MFPSRRNTITSSSLELAHTEVHVWHASLEQPPEVARELETVLTEEDQKRAGRFRYPAHRRSFIASRGILRILIHRYTGIRPDQISFNYNMAGKPYLAGPASISGLSFNLSHAGLLVLFAFSRGRQVGVDVECIRPIEEMDRIASWNFSPGEYRIFQRLPEESKLQAFYNCWSRKEAFLKAVGDGLSFPLHEIEVFFGNQYPDTVQGISWGEEAAQQWSMHDIEIPDGYAASLVVEGYEYSVSHHQWTQSQIYESEMQFREGRSG